MRVAALALVGALAVSGADGARSPEQRPSQPASPYPVTSGKVTRFEKVAEGVYYATGAGGGNSPVIVGERDVMVVDTNTTPAQTRAFLEDLKLVTTKPVRYAVNTHYHYDHTDGNQVYRERGTDVVAHDFVKYAMENYDLLHREPYMTSQVVNGQRRIEAAKRDLASTQDPVKRESISEQLKAAEKNWSELQELKVTPPNVTFSDKKVVDLGGREVHLLFLGRGHTNGDTFIYLPKERIVCTGDMLESVPAYMGDALFPEWIAALDRLKALEFDLLLPGHGFPMKDGKAKATAFQGYLRDIVTQVSDLRKQGMPATEAALKVDMSAYKAAFPSTAKPGAELRGVRHIYEWLYEQEHKR